MDIEQIRSFLAVVRARSFTAAARQRGLTQPGLSRQVQQIERELGTILFDRRTRGIHLTPAGERFLSYAESFVEQHQRLLAEMRATSWEIEGSLPIIASTTPGTYLVPEFVARFAEQHPRVQPVVVIADSTAVIESLKNRDYDLGFTGIPVHSRSLSSWIVGDDEVVLAVPAHHPLAGRPAVSLDELADFPFLDREEGSGTLQTLRAALAQRSQALPERRVVMVLSSCEAIIAGVRQGLGVGFVSARALEHVAPADVVGVRLADLTVRRHLYLVHRTRSTISPVAEAFVRFVHQATRPVAGLTDSAIPMSAIS